MTDRIVVPTSAAFLREPRTVPVTKRFIHGFIFLIPNAAIASSLLVFTLKCVGYPVPYLTPGHPVIIFGDSITEGYGATNTRLPVDDARPPHRPRFAFRPWASYCLRAVRES
jgi:hypothetical protein